MGLSLTGPPVDARWKECRAVPLTASACVLWVFDGSDEADTGLFLGSARCQLSNQPLRRA